MAIDRDYLRALRTELDSALAEIGKRHGMSIRCGNARFDPSSFSMHIEGKLTDKVSLKADADEAKRTFTACAPMLGLKPAWFGKTFNESYSNHGGTIIGCKPNAPKFSVIVRDYKGKVKLWPAERVAAAMQAQQKAAAAV